MGGSFAVFELGKKMNFRPMTAANLQGARGLLLYLSAGLEGQRGRTFNVQLNDRQLSRLAPSLECRPPIGAAQGRSMGMASS